MWTLMNRGDHMVFTTPGDYTKTAGNTQAQVTRIRNFLAQVESMIRGDDAPMTGGFDLRQNNQIRSLSVVGYHV